MVAEIEALQSHADATQACGTAANEVGAGRNRCQEQIYTLMSETDLVRSEEKIW
jgi:hypothetical protein